MSFLALLVGDAVERLKLAEKDGSGVAIVAARARVHAGRDRLEELRLAPGLTRAWDETKHPRDHGRFAAKGSVDVGGMMAEEPIGKDEASFAYPGRLAQDFGLSPEEKHELMFRLRERYSPVDFIARGMARYRQEKGLPEPQATIADIPADMPKGKQVAEAFEGIADEADRPEVQSAFEDFKRQNADMWDFATKPVSEGGLGIMVDFTNERDPYSSAAEQAADLRDHHHITIESGLGGDHPLLTAGEYDRFRAVHDIFGHAGVGSGFDRHGEAQAWLTHMSMYTGAGRDAMSSEYHGANSSMWAGANAGTGKAVLLPASLIASPWGPNGEFRGMRGDQ